MTFPRTSVPRRAGHRPVYPVAGEVHRTRGGDVIPATAAVELDRLFRAWIEDVESVPFPVTTLEGQR